MKWFTNIRLRIGKWCMRKRAGKNSRKKIVHNFNTAKTVCLIFEGSDPSTVRYVKEFRNYLDSIGLETYLLVYADMAEIPGELIFLQHATVFSRKDIDIFFRPKKIITNIFLGKSFDILIDLSFNRYFPLSYLNTLSLSGFKTGNYTEEYNDYDLMINTGNNSSTDYLIEQIKHYVALLNNPAG